MAEAAAGAETPQLNRRRIVLLLEYDGRRFAGSQLQKNALTVQAVLEEAIEKTTTVASRAAFAGRTDAGTHARGQVASFLTDSRLDLPVMQRALNRWLPADVAVRDLSEADEDFDVRRDAVRRHYRYVINTSKVRPVIGREYSWHVARDLDVAAMGQAASRLLGVHDFAAFAGPLESEDASTVRHLYCFDVRRCGDELWFDAIGSAFLPHQVRRMVGSLVEVGRGKITAGEYAAQLDGPPASAGPVAPSHGLCLIGVEYETPLFRVGLDSNQLVC